MNWAWCKWWRIALSPLRDEMIYDRNGRWQRSLGAVWLLTHRRRRSGGFPRQPGESW